MEDKDMFVLVKDLGVTQEQRLWNLYHDYHEADELYVESVCRGKYACTTEYKQCARQWKTKESAQKMLDKLVDFQGVSIKEKGYTVKEI